MSKQESWTNWTPRQETLAIIEAVAHDHGITTHDVLGPCRRKPIVKARQAAMVAVARARPMLSLLQLGGIFRRDHTTVMYAFSKLGYQHDSLGARRNDQANKNPNTAVD